MEYEIWCRYLRRYRKETRGMTQREVAQGINISRPHYSAIEQGRTMVNYKHLYNLAKFFRVRMGDLVTFSMLRRNKKRG